MDVFMIYDLYYFIYDCNIKYIIIIVCMQQKGLKAARYIYRSCYRWIAILISLKCGHCVWSLPVVTTRMPLLPPENRGGIVNATWSSTWKNYWWYGLGSELIYDEENNSTKCVMHYEWPLIDITSVRSCLYIILKSKVTYSSYLMSRCSRCIDHRMHISCHCDLIGYTNLIHSLTSELLFTNML